MTVLNLAFTEVKDTEKMQAYIAAAAPLMEEIGAEVVVRGKYLKSILGTDKGEHIAGIFRFPDMVTAETFYNSAQYMALIDLRNDAGNMTFNFYEE